MSPESEGLKLWEFEIPLDRAFHAFGDGSETAHGAHYGMVLFPDYSVEDALTRLEDIKQLFNGKRNHPLHCRELFNDKARAKTGWAHLDARRSRELGEAVLKGMSDFNPKYLLGSLPVAHYPKRFRLKGKNGHADHVHDVNPKWLTLWPYFAIAQYLQPTEIRPPIDPVRQPYPASSPKWRVVAKTTAAGLMVSRIYLDRETTKIPWVSKSVQWSTVASDFVLDGPFGASHLPIQQIGINKHPLLEVADLFVYAAASGLGPKWALSWDANTSDLLWIELPYRGEEMILGGQLAI